jgi:cysteinyl-tRNA synthetase
MLKLFNAYGRSLEDFEPISDREVKLYTCGPTIWNYPHIGNYRTFLFEDLLKRYLRYKDFKVIHVMNLTDLDDRIIKICKERNVGLKEFTQPYADAFFEDLDYLRVEKADYYPKASEHIEEMVKLVEGLLEKGYAYKSEDGSIYFNISKFPRYGRLSGLKIDELKAGARVRQDDYDKNSAQDFALWKGWDENDGNIFWNTSLGRGRPGWHIECSAMSMKYLGSHIDIHTGGVDNMFPHHENEIAQSESYTGEKFVNYWLEGEHLLINLEKMAKRLGNIITVRELREQGVGGSALRYYLLSAQYRTQLNFTDQSLEQAEASVRRLNEFVARLDDDLHAENHHRNSEVQTSSSDLVTNLVNRTRGDFVTAMDNDLDTPRALAVIFDYVSQANKLVDHNGATTSDLKMLLDFMVQEFDRVFAVLQRRELAEGPPSDEVAKLLQERNEARASKNCARSDDLRRRILEQGYEVQDTQNGQKLRKRKKIVLES